MGKLQDSNHPKATSSNSGEFDGLLMLGAAELRAILTPALCLMALEEAYRHLHAAPADGSRSVGFQARDGKFHVKAGLYPRTHKYFAAKVNANFPDNPRRHGLPTIQGVVLLCDGADGHPVAILDSGELTGRRTAAATALAAKHGARADSKTLALIGCGAQARYQVEALQGVVSIERILAHDRDPDRADRIVAWASESLGLEVQRAAGVTEAVVGSDITVTCTTAASAFLMADMVPAGAFVAAVGADNPDKQELDPKLFAKARILVDDLEQCAGGGDLAHAIRAGHVTEADVTATLAQLSAGVRQARAAGDEIVLFDSTGTGLQDVAVAAAAYDAFRNGLSPV